VFGAKLSILKNNVKKKKKSEIKDTYLHLKKEKKRRQYLQIAIKPVK